MIKSAALLATILSGPAFAQEYPQLTTREIPTESVVIIGALTMATAAWLAYNAGDDAAESQRNLRTIGAAYALWGGAILINSSQVLTLLPIERGAVLRMEIRFGG